MFRSSFIVISFYIARSNNAFVRAISPYVRTHAIHLNWLRYVSGTSIPNAIREPICILRWSAASIVGYIGRQRGCHLMIAIDCVPSDYKLSRNLRTHANTRSILMRHAQMLQVRDADFVRDYRSNSLPRTVDSTEPNIDSYPQRDLLYLYWSFSTRSCVSCVNDNL